VLSGIEELSSVAGWLGAPIRRGATVAGKPEHAHGAERDQSSPIILPLQWSKSPAIIPGL
jgi:hypothetical protein